MSGFQRFAGEKADVNLSFNQAASNQLQFPPGSGLVEVFGDTRCYSPDLDVAGQFPYVQPLNISQSKSQGWT
jgi:hypothetical protein